MGDRELANKHTSAPTQAQIIWMITYLLHYIYIWIPQVFLLPLPLIWLSSWCTIHLALIVTYIGMGAQVRKFAQFCALMTYVPSSSMFDLVFWFWLELPFTGFRGFFLSRCKNTFKGSSNHMYIILVHLILIILTQLMYTRIKSSSMTSNSTCTYKSRSKVEILHTPSLCCSIYFFKGN